MTPSWCLVIAVLYHLRDELDCQYNANNTGDGTLYFSDQRGELLGSGRNGLHTISGINRMSETCVAYLAYLQ